MERFSFKPKERTVERPRLTTEFADNGWLDWFCENCGRIHNDDVHVMLDWCFCPYCGGKFIRKQREQS